MVKQITKLTDAQAARMPEWRDRWIGIGLSCDALTEKDRRESEAAIRHLYRKAGLEAPKVVLFLPSPFALRCAAGIAGGAIFATRNGFPVFVMISDRPIHIRRNAAGQMHSDVGSAIGFRDGWELFFWHGLLIPPSHHWIISHKDRISPENIELEPNAELRRVMLEIYGFDRYAAARDAKVVSADELHGFPRRLLEIDVKGEKLRVIEVINGSLEPDGSRRKFHLGALRGETPHDVVAASYGIAPKHYREAVRS